MQGDLDNIIKPILDALSRYVFVDDAQVERLVVQRFLPDGAPELTDPSNVLKQAWQAERPVLYVRISDDLMKEPT